MSIGFIGCGNMASAIIKGITESGIIDGKDIYIFDTSPSTLENASAKYAVNKCQNAREVVRLSEYVILAVKPNVLSTVLNDINIVLEESGAVLVSIAAGKTIDFIREHLSHDNKIIRVMPNINAKVACACSAYCANTEVTDAEKKEIERLFAAVGEIIELPESDFPLFGVLSGCSPAFSYMFIDALARAGVKNGMKKDLALKIAAQTVLGSAKMILESGSHPYELIDQVCSPGGTTIEGITSLQADGFETAVHNAVDSAVKKDKLL